MPVTLRGLGNCEEELPKKPVGRQLTDSRPTVDRQVFWGALLHNYRGLRVKDFVIFSMNVLGS